MNSADIQNNILLLILISLGLFVILIVRLCLIYLNNKYLLDTMNNLIKIKNYKSALNTGLKYLKSEIATFQVYYLLAQSYEGLQQYPNAIDYFEKALVKTEAEKRIAMKITILLKLGVLYQKMNDTKAAMSCYNSVLRENPKNLDALFHSAEIFYKTNNLTIAMKNLEIYLSEKPSQVKANLMLANIYSKMQYYQKSIQKIDSIRNSNERLTAAFNYEITQLLANNHIALKNYDKAIEILKPFLQNKQTVSAVLEKIVYTLLKSNKNQEAIDIAYEHLVNIPQEDRCSLLYQIGKAYFNNGEIYKAIELWTQAHRINPNYNDLKLLLSEHHSLLEYHTLETLFTSKNDLFTDTILKKLKISSANTIEVADRYGIFKEEDNYHIIFRFPNEITLQDLAVIYNAIINLSSKVKLMILYSFKQLSDRKTILL